MTGALLGCSHARPAPPVVVEPVRPPEKTWLDSAAESTGHVADATWNAVSAPARWINAPKKPPATRPVYEAPDALIISTDPDGVRPVMVPLAEEPATRPTTRPKPK